MIYILRLQGGHYYVGKSDNVIARYQQHLNGNGSAWTKKHPPISLEKTIENTSPFDEDNYTKQYMATYGIDKVRGGSYANIVLTDEQMTTLTREIRGAEDKCQRCDRAGHFMANCYAKTPRISTPYRKKRVESSEEESEEESDEESEEESDEEYECDYCDRTFTTQFGCSNHEKSCVVKMAMQQVLTHNVRTSYKDVCYRCGREGHYATDCYASRDVHGERI